VAGMLPCNPGIHEKESDKSDLIGHAVLDTTGSAIVRNRAAHLPALTRPQAETGPQASANTH
jgi:hypothetical protein